MAANRPAKTWEMVLNNYNDDEVDQWMKILGNEDIVKRAVVGKEVGENGTPHLQGRATFKTTKRMAQLKKLLGIQVEDEDGNMAFVPSRAHFEITKATKDWSYLYKGEVIIDVANQKQGKRTDLEEVAAAVREGSSLRDIAMTFPVAYIRYHNGIRALQEETKEAKTPTRMWTADDFKVPTLNWDAWTRRSWILFGPPNTGKTNWALCSFETPLLVRHLDDLKQLKPEHDGIVFDDMEFKHLPRSTQIHLVDYEFASTIYARYTNATIPRGMRRIFTTNESPDDLFKWDGAISRRVNVCHVNRSLITGDTVCSYNGAFDGDNEQGNVMESDEEVEIV